MRAGLVSSGVPLGERRRRAVVIVAMVGAAASSATGALLFGALPTIAEDLGTTTSVISWLGVAPSIALAVSMPLFGKLGDLYGHRNVFIFGWVAAALFSFAAAASPNAGVLIVLRTLGSLAGNSTSPAAYGVLARVFPPSERAGPYSKVTVALAVSPLVAVAVGGTLVDAVGWRVLFIAQGVASLVAVAFAVRLLPQTAGQPGVRFDIAGVVTLAGGMTCALLAVNRWRTWGGISHSGIVTLGAIGVIGLFAFAVIERRVRDPLLAPAMLRNRAVASAMGTNLFVNAGFNGLDVLTPFAARELFGYSAAGIAYINGVRALGFAIGATSARRILGGWGGQRVVYFGHTIMFASCLAVAYGFNERSEILMIGGLIVGSFGTGFARPSIATAITNAVDEADAGIANGANNMAHQIGASVGQTALIAVAAGSAAGDFASASLLAAGFAAASLATARFMRPKAR